MFICEIDPFALEHLKSDVDIVDFLQAADRWQTEFQRQTPILNEELHHTTAGKPHEAEFHIKSKNMSLISAVSTAFT